MNYPKTVQEILDEKVLPSVAADHNGLLTLVNDAFQKAYGWNRDDLLGKSITTIMPPYMRDSHNVGFSRFLTTEKATVAAKPLPLPVLCKDGRVVDAEHFILAEKIDGNWIFAATINPNR